MLAMCAAVMWLAAVRVPDAADTLPAQAPELDA